MRCVMGFDLGTRGGLCVARREHEEAPWNFRTFGWDMSKSVGWPQNPARGYHEWEMYAGGFMESWVPEAIAYEHPSFMRGQGAVHILRQQGILFAAAGSLGIELVVPIAVPSLKKWATGSGKAEKDAMIVAARDRGLLEPGKVYDCHTLKNDGEAEAALVAGWLIEHAVEGP